MKYFDRVKVISDDYEEYGIKRGDEGHILTPEIRDGTFLFCRENPETGMDDADAEKSGVAVQSRERLHRQSARRKSKQNRIRLRFVAGPLCAFRDSVTRRAEPRRLTRCILGNAKLKTSTVIQDNSQQLCCRHAAKPKIASMRNDDDRVYDRRRCDSKRQFLGCKDPHIKA